MDVLGGGPGCSHGTIVGHCPDWVPIVHVQAASDPKEGEGEHIGGFSVEVGSDKTSKITPVPAAAGAQGEVAGKEDQHLVSVQVMAAAAFSRGSRGRAAKA